MNRINILFLLLFAFVFQGQTQAQYFSSEAEISLVTCSPGSELYSIFGHSAIRVEDTATNTDLIFNYGVFDFNTPNFYWKFVKGKLQYRLAIQRTSDFIRAYQAEGRSVKVEKMRLTEREQNRLLQFLRINYLPENRYYLYDFFYNNCSTKIWDVTEEQVADSLTFDTSVYEALSFRNLLYLYLETVPWSKLGIDLLLGMPADKTASFEEQMYLPDYLSRNMSHTIRSEGKLKNTRLLGPEQIILERDPSKSNFNAPVVGPMMVFMGLLLIMLLITLWGRPGLKRGVDTGLLLITGLLGVVLLFMWFASDHQQMDGNLNLLWANPLGLVFVYYAIRNQMRNAGITYSILGVFVLVNLLAWNWLPQQFNLALLPLLAGMLIRGVDNFLSVYYPGKEIRHWLGLSRNQA